MAENFSELRDKTDNELDVMLVWYISRSDSLHNSRMERESHVSVLGLKLTHTGFTMLSFDQGNPTLKSDDTGQTWLISAWFMNKYKGGMSQDIFRRNMNFSKENYNSDAADAMYGSYMKGEDISY